MVTEEWEWSCQFSQFDGRDDAQVDERRDGTIFGVVLGYIEPMEHHCSWRTLQDPNKLVQQATDLLEEFQDAQV